MSHTEIYKKLILEILNGGESRSDRTGTGTLSLFAPPPMVFDLSNGFPLITAKRTSLKSAFNELSWFLKGTDNLNDLDKSIHSWWKPWADTSGDLPFMYGYQWKRGDQLNRVIKDLKEDPNSRRHVIALWNPETVGKQPLACCHGTVIQFYVNKGKLDMFTHQRSSDSMLGLPYNLASYGLLNLMISHVVGLSPGKMIYSLGDAHIYSNHEDGAREMLLRPSLPDPSVELSQSAPKDIYRIKFSDFRLIGYEPHPAIKLNLSV